MNEKPPLVDNMIDIDQQIQQDGIDLTLMMIERIKSIGCLDFDNTERKISEGEVVPFDDLDWAYLPPGVYRITVNEIVNIPNWLTGQASSRSSLIRCGAFLVTAYWDSGYSGRSQCLLCVNNPIGLRLKRNAKIVQIMFMTLDRAIDDLYDGIYQGENTKRVQQKLFSYTV